MDGLAETSMNSHCVVDSNCITASDNDTLNFAGDFNCADALINNDNAASIIYPCAL